MSTILGIVPKVRKEKRMERMEEEIPDSEYRAYQHFITNSNWNYRAVLSKVAKTRLSFYKKIKL